MLMVWAAVFGEAARVNAATAKTINSWRVRLWVTMFMLVPFDLLFTIFYFLFAICYLLFTIYYLLFSIFYFLFAIFYFLFAICYFLLCLPCRLKSASIGKSNLNRK